MKALQPLIASAVLLVLAGAPTHGDVSVEPDPRNSSVRLKGHRVTKPHNAKVNDGERRYLPPRYYTHLCPVDAEVMTYGCRTYRPEDPDEAELSEGDIVRAVRQIGLPSLEVQIQPGISTLVNVATIFYTEPQQFNRSVMLLGFDVDLAATPVRYRWLHGDGTASTTTKPGKPYPSTEVTHHYRQPAEAVNPRVDVTYRVRYRVDGGPWNTIDQTLLASGQTTALEVKEAAPVLTHP